MNKLVILSSRYSIEVAGCTQTLTIPDITLEDASNVSYSIENAFTEATLTVDGKFYYHLDYVFYSLILSYFYRKV